MPDSFLLKQDGDYLLQQNGDKIILNLASVEPVIFCMERRSSYVPGLKASAVNTHVDDLLAFPTGGETSKRC